MPVAQILLEATVHRALTLPEFLLTLVLYTKLANADPQVKMSTTTSTPDFTIVAWNRGQIWCIGASEARMLYSWTSEDVLSYEATGVQD